MELRAGKKPLNIDDSGARTCPIEGGGIVRIKYPNRLSTAVKRRLRVELAFLAELLTIFVI